MKDFSPAKAAKWVEQELASCKARNEDPKVVADRYEADGKLFEMFADKMPNSTSARKTLIARLRQI